VACELPLGEYLDGELSGDARRRVEIHLEECADCRRRVELEQAFREIYIAPLRPDEPPRDVRERIERFVAGLDDARAPTPVWPRIRRRIAVAAAMVALVVAGAAGTVLIGGNRAAASLVRLADASVEQHQRLSRGVLPLDISQVSAKEAERWFGQKLEFDVRLPELTRDDLTRDELTFVGGRLSHLEGFDVAALKFRVEDQDVSLFIMPAEQYRKLGLRDEPRFKMVNRHGYDVIVWQSHGVAYALVSEIGGRSCAVCHAPGEKLDVTLKPEIHQAQ
jgi:anti-sigma factor RsiW